MLRGSCLLSSRDGVGQGKTVKVEKEGGGVVVGAKKEVDGSLLGDGERVIIRYLFRSI